MTEQAQSKVVPLTYEQEVHALLHAAAANTEGLLRYFEAQAAQETGDAKRLTQKCIDWKRDDLQRIRALIPQALERRDATRDSHSAKVEQVTCNINGTPHQKTCGCVDPRPAGENS